MSSDLITPTAHDVADLLQRLSHSQWPTSDAERVAWCHRFGLPDTRDPQHRPDPTGQAFAAPAATTRPGRNFGWHTYRGDFVGVSWFLWDELPRAEVRARAVQLKTLIDQHFGPPAHEFPGDPATPLGFTSWWQQFGRTVELYFHTGIHTRPSGEREDGPAVVQLHLNDTARSDAQEAHARRHPPSRPSSPA